MDGPYAAVKFPPKESGLQGANTRDITNNDEASYLLQDVRLLRKDELQVLCLFFLEHKIIIIMKVATVLFCEFLSKQHSDVCETCKNTPSMCPILLDFFTDIHKDTIFFCQLMQVAHFNLCERKLTSSVRVTLLPKPLFTTQ